MTKIGFHSFDSEPVTNTQQDKDQNNISEKNGNLKLLNSEKETKIVSINENDLQFYDRESEKLKKNMKEDSPNSKRVIGKDSYNDQEITPDSEGPELMGKK